jgi:hypothetical protein
MVAWCTSASWIDCGRCLSDRGSWLSLAQHLAESMEMPDWVVRRYLDDLADEDLAYCPIPEVNPIAWQLGHLILSERQQLYLIAGGERIGLPEGFEKLHARPEPGQRPIGPFLSKEDYLRLMGAQRGMTLQTLRRLTDQQLLAPPPESLHYFGPTVASVIAGQAAHWLMHAGQWAIIRRFLGRPALF